MNFYEGNMKKRKNFLFFAAAVGILYAIFHILNIGCPIKFFTGISCAGCGMTRAWQSLLMMDIKKAFYYHPLVLIPFVYVPLFLFRDKIGAKYFGYITKFLISIFMAVYFIRLFSPRNTVITADIKNGFIFRVLKKFFDKSGIL